MRIPALDAVRAVDAYLDARRDYAPIFIRLATGFHLIYGTQDNIFSYERMLEFERFLAANGFPFTLFSAFLSAYAQFICGILMVLGLATRPAAAVMVINFLVAIGMVHVGRPYPEGAPAVWMLSSSLFLLVYGAGRLSLDAALGARRTAAFSSRLSALGGGGERNPSAAGGRASRREVPAFRSGREPSAEGREL